MTNSERLDSLREFLKAKAQCQGGCNKLTHIGHMTTKPRKKLTKHPEWGGWKFTYKNKKAHVDTNISHQGHWILEYNGKIF